MTNKNLYNSILEYKFDGDYKNVDISFEKKLYDVNLGWSPEYLKRVVLEYKKLMYLAAVYKKISPPDSIMKNLEETFSKK